MIAMLSFSQENRNVAIVKRRNTFFMSSGINYGDSLIIQ